MNIPRGAIKIKRKVKRKRVKKKMERKTRGKKNEAKAKNDGGKENERRGPEHI